jgi:hypothetical protein
MFDLAYLKEEEQQSSFAIKVGDSKLFCFFLTFVEPEQQPFLAASASLSLQHSRFSSEAKSAKYCCPVQLHNIIFRPIPVVEIRTKNAKLMAVILCFVFVILTNVGEKRDGNKF